LPLTRMSGILTCANRQSNHEGMSVDSATDQLLNSPEFKTLVARRWRVSIVLTAVLFVVYYGFIIMVATNKALLAQRIGAATTLAIPLGVAVIVAAWALTAFYIVWANRQYDPHVQTLRDRLTHRK
jgi:uncharacterized membrane protein (DUF485 family)